MDVGWLGVVSYLDAWRQFHIALAALDDFLNGDLLADDLVFESANLRFKVSDVALKLGDGLGHSKSLSATTSIPTCRSSVARFLLRFDR